MIGMHQNMEGGVGVSIKTERGWRSPPKKNSGFVDATVAQIGHMELGFSVSSNFHFFIHFRLNSFVFFLQNSD